MAVRPEDRSPATLRSGDDGFDIRRIQPLICGAGATSFSWPSDDLNFLSEVLRTQHTPAPLIERLIAHAAAPDRTMSPVERLEHALAAHCRFLPLEDASRLPAWSSAHRGRARPCSWRS